MTDLDQEQLRQEVALATGHTFEPFELLLTAMTHPSYAHERGLTETYQRLEYLGDAVLQLMVTEMLVRRYPDESEGQLSRLRRAIVDKNGVYRLGVQLGVPDWLRLGRGEASKPTPEIKIVSDATEALLGALFSQAGYGGLQHIAERYVSPLVDEVYAAGGVARVFTDPRGALMELAAARGWTVEERTVSVTGPSHEPTFEVEVLVNDHVISTGSASRRTTALAQASRQALNALAEADPS